MSLARCIASATVRASRSISRQLCVVNGIALVRTVPVRQYCAVSERIITTISSNMYIAEERGSPYSPDYRVYFRDESGPISPLHDIPLWADKDKRILNMVVEIPRWTNAKMEISLGEPLNPIKQDVKKGALRYVSNVFPHRGYIWNYGALPQTWENPHHLDPGTGARGDNDPVDVIEIGERVAQRGDVIRVRLLGALALLDEGETDWKLIAIDERDSLANTLRDVNDVERVLPGLLAATVEWFRLYKVPDGKPVNEFAFDGQAKDAAFAYGVVDEVHGFWRGLLAGDVPDATDINKMNVTVEGSAEHVDRSEAAAVLSAAPPRGLPQTLPSSVDKWHFLSNL